MYAGKVAEISDVKTIFKNPLHPYTRALLKSFPSLELDVRELEGIPGSVPSLIDPPKGCVFYSRCDSPKDKCETERPKLVEVSKDHWVACFY